VGEYRHLSSAVVAEAGFLTLVEDRFASPEDEEFVRFVVRHPGAVVAVPVVDGSSALCVRQFRAAVRRTMLELPAGKLDVPGEDPADAMTRELAEEVGQRPGRLVELGQFWNSPGFCTELTRVYLALDLEPVEAAEPAKEEERHMTIEPVPLGDTARLVAEGTIADAKTIVGLFLAERWLAGQR
jgi:8-oxo-dGTP pyrophosphatase MutT (NUDIX family)